VIEQTSRTDGRERSLTRMPFLEICIMLWVAGILVGLVADAVKALRR
jgi:beta-lactamase regulating signal transducer with metallopeptidase domain